MRYLLFFSFALLFFFSNTLRAQSPNDSDYIKFPKKIYVVTENDGTKHIGKIISRDEREIIMDKKNLGRVAIPMHNVREIKPADKDEVGRNGEIKNSENFSTRYFITANGLPIKEGESYLVWNLFGGEYETSIGNNFGVGIMTTWIGLPVIGTAKFSMELSKDIHLGIGALIGTGSFWLPRLGFGLPYAALTFGDRSANITFSGGYGQLWGFDDFGGGGHSLASVAAMAKVSEKVSLVFDSFILPSFGEGNHGFGFFIPGLRFQTSEKKSFQFGFAGIYADGQIVPGAIPFIQWFRML